MRPAAPSGFVPLQSGRHLYQTNTSYVANNVLSACSAGYHTASLWEILDVSNLAYDYNNPSAKTQDDSGHGPPSGLDGWVRTGYSSSSDGTAGSGNCLNWTSNGSIRSYGTAVRLANDWTSAPGDISTWVASSFTCNATKPVWCVGDFTSVYLPVVSR